ncbi:MAG TPA: heparinase II/III-family protein [Longimicrobiales bacterium]
MRLTRLPLLARTLPRLGLANVLRVAAYRIGARTGVHPVRRQHAAPPRGPYFRAPAALPPAVPAVGAWQGSARYFGQREVPLGDGPPDWFANPIEGTRLREPGRDWWQIPDFDAEVGDIKGVWEASRMDWTLAFAQRARHGDPRAHARLEQWLADWVARNPPYRGPNWKCGQEASIRVMHLATAALILDQAERPLPGLLDLVEVHLRRIAPTIQYAVAQDNNHGTSEAAALFIGGSWLAAAGRPSGARAAARGRRLLEERVARLVGPQGTFSQYSLNYHRVLLDTLAIAEVWRRALALPPFSPELRQRAAAGAEWLRHMVQAETGDGPNVGANDGARLIPLTATDYRDYRPSVQLASVLFSDARAYGGEGAWNDAARWLGVALPDRTLPPPASRAADDGGFAVLRRGPALALLRYPRFRFRPSQADLLHVDLWVGGENVLRDAGTFSYHTDARWLRYFAGTESHNTVQFDGRDQMPRLGRFLFGDWLEPTFVEARVEAVDDRVAAAAGYRDRAGASHERRVELTTGALRVRDRVAGFQRSAVLRWRLAPGAWQMERPSSDVARVTGGGYSLIVRASVAMRRAELVEGWESRYYGARSALPVLEVELAQDGELTTDVTWAS